MFLREICCKLFATVANISFHFCIPDLGMLHFHWSAPWNAGGALMGNSFIVFIFLFKSNQKKSTRILSKAFLLFPI